MVQDIPEFRSLFVELVDDLLDLMESNPDFKYFHFDGWPGALRLS